MNRRPLEKYAPQARRDFVQAVTDRALLFGIRAPKPGADGPVIEPVIVQGDVAMIAGNPFPRAVAAQRRRLEDRIARNGFAATMEAIAYTWFNRLVAIRYMEIHGYLDHGWRVLSHPAGKPFPEILEHASDVELPGLNQRTATIMQREGTREGELYRMLLVAQCNALHRAMPFLFERIDDETELLLPDNLLHTDSIVRKLAGSIDEEDWHEVEIIGWLYQFYISERKAEVIGRVVQSEDIPAATQLFTPNWIVKYLVQNSLGRQWMATYPDSPLRGTMEYYIEPAEQTPEVREQLRAITPASLNPEALTLLDPACGSGHILVEAYDLFKAIYQERGYRPRDIPRLILEKNLFGLEIDDRAAQLAGFALVMKARADDRSILKDGVQPRVLAIQEPPAMRAADIADALNRPIVKGAPALEPRSLFQEIDDASAPLFGSATLAVAGSVDAETIRGLYSLFQHGKTFGSLIRIDDDIKAALPALAARVRDVMEFGGMFEQDAARAVMPLVEQAELLARQYDAVVANPPYLNSSAMDRELKEYVSKFYSHGKSDLFSAFIERNCDLAKETSLIGFMTPFVWMFLKSYENLRKFLIESKSITSLVRPEYHAFFDSAFVPICAFTLRNSNFGEVGQYFDLSRFYGADLQSAMLKAGIENLDCDWRYSLSSREFINIPGFPIAYWTNDSIREIFAHASSLSKIAEPKQGLATGNNDRFLRFWNEVDFHSIMLGCKNRTDASLSNKKWFPCNKGGAYRKWYGNNEYVVNWQNDGAEIREFRTEDGRLRSRPQNMQYYFREGITWSTISSSYASFRYSSIGSIFEPKAQCVCQRII